MKIVFAGLGLPFSHAVPRARRPGTRPLTAGAALVLGWLLGTAFTGRIQGAGITELHGFTNDFNPSALVQGIDGRFYGTAGSAAGGGVAFRITADGVFSRLAGLNRTDAAPLDGGPLVQDVDGNFLGTAHGGGAKGLGSIFKVTSAGAVTRLVSFNGTNGAYPSAGLTLDANGNRYGTTAFGGAEFHTDVLTVPGTVFRLGTNGELTTLVSFNGTNGATPQAPLIWGSDGSLYGTTIGGGPGNLGTVFKLSTSGSLTTLLAFNGTNGANPFGGLVQATDGAFYGTTVLGGANDLGTVFRLTTNGSLTTLFSFNGTNGSFPYAGLIQGRDGGLYGTTDFGGLGFDGKLNPGLGSVFRISLGGDLTTLDLFNGTNGAHPVTSLVQGKDGYLYGTCSAGGSAGAGNVYRFASRFLVELSAQSESELTLSWNAVKGQTYQAQTSLSLSPPTWSNLGGATVATNTVMRLSVNPQSALRRFYRALELP